MSFEDISTVQNVCQNIFPMLGYNQIETETQLNDDEFEVVDSNWKLP